jgi:hypothetical protein
MAKVRRCGRGWWSRMGRGSLNLNCKSERWR